MSTPGVSLFQGAESIKINTSQERAEEEEELEDQRRRNEELGNLLQNAFDDLDDDETTVDSTTGIQSHLIDDTHPQQQLQPIKEHQPYMNMEQQQHQQNAVYISAEMHNLKMLLESRTNELESMKKLANEEYKKRDELQKRFIITEAELDRALATKKNTHELLVESKEKCSNLENIISKLKNDKKSLETENNTLIGKLETAQTLLSDVQGRYDMVQRDMNIKSDRHMELRRKQNDERHRAEIHMIQQQLEQVSDKLDKKTIDLENMNTRYKALQCSNEQLLVDKASRINELNHALMESQKKCNELLCREDYFHENMRLQKLISSLQDQIEGMERTIKSLNERLDFTTAELDVMDSVLHQHNLDDTPRRLSQTQGRVVGSTPLNTVDRIGNLKAELCRALANVKSKREEIRKLQQNLEEKSNEIRTLREEENRSLVQITTLKEDKIRLENRLKILDEEINNKTNKSLDKSLNDTRIQTLKDELKDLQDEKDELEKEYKRLEIERNDLIYESKRADVKMNNFEVDLEELKQEHESMKMNYERLLKENENLRSRTTADNVRLDLEKHKFLLKDALAECDRLKKLYIEISNAKDTLSYDLEKLRNSDNVKELQVQCEKSANLQRALQLAEIRAAELKKILETEKLSHEQELKAMQEKMDKERTKQLKEAKEDINNCTKCIDYIADITKFEIQNLKLTNSNDNCRQEIEKLRKELQIKQSHIIELNDKLKLSDDQEQLIKELKTKATHFEEYIKNHSSSSNNSCDKGVGTSPESSTKLDKQEIRRIESRIREEMTKIFTIEFKKAQQQIKESEDKSECIQHEYQHITEELQQRQQEVDLLKQAILAEREQIEVIMEKKEIEFNDITQKQNVILLKYRDELQLKTQKLVDLTKELNDRQQQIEAERQSMKAVMTQWEEQRQTTDAIETEWKAKFDEFKRMHEETLTLWHTKYNSAKRTCANYKRYSEDKEAHMLKEYERLKYEYDGSVKKIEMRMKELLDKKTRDGCIICKMKSVDKTENKENKANN